MVAGGHGVLTGFAVRAAGNRDLYDAARAPCLQPSKAKWCAGCRTRWRQMGRGRSSTLASLRMPQAVAALAAPHTTMGRVLACRAHSGLLPAPCGPRQAQSATRPGDQNAHPATAVGAQGIFRVTIPRQADAYHCAHGDGEVSLPPTRPSDQAGFLRPTDPRPHGGARGSR